MRKNENYISFTIQDERENFTHPKIFTCYFHPLETRTLADLYNNIFCTLQIPAAEQEACQISFRINNEKIHIRYPSELLGSDNIVAIISEHDPSNAFSDSVETDKSKYNEEHANPMPHFPIHQSNNRENVFLIKFSYKIIRKIKKKKKFHMLPIYMKFQPK